MAETLRGWVLLWCFKPNRDVSPAVGAPTIAQPRRQCFSTCELVGPSEQKRMAAAERNKYKTDLEKAKAECRQWKAQYRDMSQRRDDEHRIQCRLRRLMKGAELRRDAQHAARGLQGEECGS